MITPSFSLTATERVLPKLALDFTTGVLDPRITFTRATSASNPATYVNSSGVITAATNNQPRFDYDPITLICKGLLIEESRTNICLYSEHFDNPFWAAGGASVSVTANTAISPSNTQTADTLSISATALSTRQNNLITNGETYTFSVWAKASVSGGATNVRLTVNNTATWTGAASTKALLTNKWQRITLTWTANGGAFYFMIGARDAAGSADTSCYGNVDVWGAQIELGAFPTSYIPTTTTALTRNADAASMTGTNFSDWWTATIGSANVSAIPKSTSGTKPLFQMDDGTADNIISLRGNAANPELYIKATTDQAQIDAGTIVANTAYKLAGAWNTDNCAAAQNGAAAVTDTSATIPTVTQARIGSDGTNYANAWLQKINYWPQRITDNETQAFSK